jgi:predicted DNA-binding transcriptional regulator YafY
MNKHQHIRYKVINRCLRDFDNYYGWRELAEQCIDEIIKINGDRETISRKTIYNDLAYIKSPNGFNMEVITYNQGKNVYYRYEDPSITIDKQPLAPNEIEKLKEAISTLSGISGRNEFDYIIDIIPRLESSLGIKIDSTPIISYQSNPDLKNNHYVDELYQHIRNKRVLEIVYQPFNKEPVIHCFHPYFLKQSNNRWFLFGLDKEVRKHEGLHPVNLPIDRIQSITMLNKKYIPNTEIDFTTYFDDIIGTSKYKDRKSTLITLKLLPSIANYFDTKPITSNQKKIKIGEDGFYYTTIKVRPNNELYALLLSYGEGLEVISPEDVRAAMLQRVEKMKLLYGSS